jgi:hypothetical protein
VDDKAAETSGAPRCESVPGMERMVYATAVTGELSRLWPGPGGGDQEDRAPKQAGRPVPTSPAVPALRDRRATRRPPGPAAGARAARRLSRRRALVAALFVAAVVAVVAFTVATFLAPSHDAGAVPARSTQAPRTDLSHEPHGRLSDASSSANGGGQDSRQRSPGAAA